MNYKYTREEIDQLIQRQLQENLKKGQVEATATLELEKLRVQLEDLKNNSGEEPKSEEKREKILSIDRLLKQLEKAIQYDDKIVESDIVSRLNEKNRNKQLAIESKRVINI